jgi:hypothetical protein
VGRGLLGPARLVQREPDRALDERLQTAERRLARGLDERRGDLERLGVPALEDEALGATGVRLVDVAAGVDLRERGSRLVQQLVRLGEASVAARQAAEIAGAEGRADGKVRCAADAHHVPEEQLCLREPSLIGQHLRDVVLLYGGTERIAGAELRLAAGAIALDGLVPVPLGVVVNTEVVEGRSANPVQAVLCADRDRALEQRDRLVVAEIRAGDTRHHEGVRDHAREVRPLGELGANGGVLDGLRIGRPPVRDAREADLDGRPHL